MNIHAFKQATATSFLSREEELKHVTAWKDRRDPKALATIVEAYAPYIMKRAQFTHKRSSLPLEDCIQVAHEAFIMMIDRFDCSRGTRLSSFGNWELRAALEKASYMEGVLRPKVTPANKKMERVLNKELKAHPEWNTPLQEIFKTVGTQTGNTPREVENLYLQTRSVFSIDAPIHDDDSSSTWIDHIGNETEVDPSDELDRDKVRNLIKEAIASLPDRSQRIITARFAVASGSEGPETLETLAQEFGITRERVRQLEMKALKNLRNFFEENGYKAEIILGIMPS